MEICQRANYLFNTNEFIKSKDLKHVSKLNNIVNSSSGVDKTVRRITPELPAKLKIMSGVF